MRTIPRTRHTVDECNPFGMDQRRSARCVLDKPINFPDLNPTLEEYGNNTGFYWENSVSVIRTGYKAKTYPSSSYLLYKWVVTGATVVAGGTGHDYIEVETKSNNAEDPFTIDLIVRNADQEDSVSQVFRHTRVEKLYPIRITRINETAAGSCEFDTSQLCTAESTYSVSTEDSHGTIMHNWSCQGANIIDNLDGTATVTTQDDEDVDFIVSVVLKDDHSEDSASEDFSHSRIENVILPVVITDITEDTAGHCGYTPPTTGCTAISTHTAVHENGQTFSWSVVGATISAGQGTETVEVETANGVDKTFDLSVLIINALGFERRTESFTHTREELADPVAIVSLAELTPGACEFPSAGTCLAVSTYQVVGTDYVSIDWVITGATLVNGQGTDTITVSSDSGADTLFNVEVSLTGHNAGIVSENNDFTHLRTEIQEEFDQALLYDINNIATEFIA